MSDVHLDDVDGAERNQPVEVGLSVKPLAGGDRTICRAFHFGQQVQALRRDRFFTPDGAEPLESADHRSGRRRRQPAVKLDHQTHAGAHGLTHGRDDLDRRSASARSRTFQAVPNGSNLRAR